MWTLAERPKKFILTLTTVLFVGSIKDSEGNKKSVKYFNKKLKLTKDRIELIEECLGTTILSEADTPHGVCVPCFRSVEKVHNLKENLNR